MKTLRAGIVARTAELGNRATTAVVSEMATDNAERAKLYNSTRWRKRRRAFLQPHPLCIACEQRGLVVAAEVVDHRDGHQHHAWRDRFWDESRWQSMCTDCHAAKSAAELAVWQRSGQAVHEPPGGSAKKLQPRTNSACPHSKEFPPMTLKKTRAVPNVAARLVATSSPAPRKKPALPVPSHLTPDGRKIWRQVVAHLEANGAATTVIGPTIETYIDAVLRQRRLSAALADAPLIDGEGKLHGALRVLEATSATVKNLAVTLGLTTLKQRKSGGTAESPTEGKWSGVL
jgi:phage terminase small subunit